MSLFDEPDELIVDDVVANLEFLESDQALLFDPGMLPPVSLADKFTAPPLSVLNQRDGEWQDRRRRWLALGIRSEMGRGGSLTYNATGDDPVSQKLAAMGATSGFDPVTCELVYRWFSGPGARVLDPFAGGSVRGIVASTLGRWYTGIDVRQEQVDENNDQKSLGSDMAPVWICGDSDELDDLLDPADEFDLVFTCPPYADLERYSDDPCDLSTMEWPDFLLSYRRIIAASVRRLRPNRFAAVVVSEPRDEKGNYRGLVPATVAAFRDVGTHFYNEFAIVRPVGTGSLRAERSFVSSRKITRSHHTLLVFVKGDGRAATRWAAA